MGGTQTALQRFWAGLPIAGRIAVVVVPVLSLVILIGVIASENSRDEASYRYGYQQISGSAQLLLNAISETDAELGSSGTTTSKKDACRTATKGLPLVSGANPQYVEQDVIAGCVDALSGTTANAKASATSPRSSSISTSTAVASLPTSSQQGSSGASGHNTTIADYLVQNGITATPVVKSVDPPGAPILNLPSPDGWKDSGKTPQNAYGQIVATDPAFAADPPIITAFFFRLAGNADADAILRYAPGEARNLPGWEMSREQGDTLAGRRAYGISGSFLKDGERKSVGQKAVVIPGDDALYVLLLNYRSRNQVPDSQAVTEAFRAINDRTTITP